MSTNLLHTYIIFCRNLLLIMVDNFSSPSEFPSRNYACSMYIFLKSFDKNCFHHLWPGYFADSLYQLDFQRESFNYFHCKCLVKSFAWTWFNTETNSTFTVLVLTRCASDVTRSLQCPNIMPRVWMLISSSQIYLIFLISAFISYECFKPEEN